MTGGVLRVLRLALRDLRGSLGRLWVFLACVALAVAAIAGVGTLRAAITNGLSEQGAVILGGDAQIELTYRYARDEERAWMTRHALRVSEVVDFRSMAVVGDDSALAQVKAVDDAYPLTGQVVLQEGDVATALRPAGGLPQAIIQDTLADRLALRPGDTFRLGSQTFRLGAILLREPDSTGAGLMFGPRIIVKKADLATSGLLAPGTLFETQYRMTLPPDVDLAQLKRQAERAFDGKGMRWSDRRQAAPGVQGFVDRLGSFLVLVGLAGLAVGGVGVQAAVRSHLEARIATIATLRSLGASSGLIFGLFLTQIVLLALVGVVIGLVLGAGLPLALRGVIEGSLPFPAHITLAPAALAQAAYYGLTGALLFTLVPLARTQAVRAAALYRGVQVGGWPGLWPMLGVAGLTTALVGGAVAFSGQWALTLAVAGGVAAALGTLAGVALGLRHAARALSHGRLARGRPALRAALAAIGARGVGGEAVAVTLSLGLGLSVLAAVGQIDTNLRRAIATDLPTRAPAFFFIDIQPDQIDPFLATLRADPAVTRIDSAPMLRGVITQINNRPAKDVAGDHWVVRGDRGLSFADTPPPGTKLTAGAWWAAGDTGPAQVSFAAKEAAEIGLKLGDTLTINILGRDIPATITSFREVDFSSAAMGFVMILSPHALAGAPHSDIATVYTAPEHEAAILRATAKQFPNVTAIRVRDAAARVAEALGAIASATTWAAGGTLATGIVVLIGAAAAGLRARSYEAAILKTLGATRATVLASLALRAGLTGAAAGAVALGAGAAAGWAVMRLVMQTPYHFAVGSAFGIVAMGVGASLLAGLIFAAPALRARPAQVLRGE